MVARPQDIIKGLTSSDYFTAGGKDPQKDFKTYLNKVQSLFTVYEGLLEVFHTPGKTTAQETFPISAYQNEAILKYMNYKKEDITSDHIKMYELAWLYYDQYGSYRYRSL